MRVSILIIPLRRSPASADQKGIDNPLAHLSPDRLERNAREFAERINSNEPDYQFWSKATQVARFQHTPFCDRIKGLTALEKRTIREQKNLGFWQQPRPLRVTITTLCLAAVIQGWVQTGLVSSILQFYSLVSKGS
jgi:hypothetical protein